jgi:predicted DsbA family dithiol-disulfide isomerase
MPMKVEVFTSQPPCSGGRVVLKLIEEIKKEYGNKIEVEIHKGPTEKAKEYGLKVSPAIVIDKDIRIIGVCPSKATLIDALREAGLS